MTLERFILWFFIAGILWEVAKWGLAWLGLYGVDFLVRPHSPTFFRLFRMLRYISDVRRSQWWREDPDL